MIFNNYAMIRSIQYMRFIYLLILLSVPLTSAAQTVITLEQYLNLVGKQSLSYIAAQYNVSIAEAGIESARVFPDPELSIGAYDNQQSTLHLGRGYNANIGTTLELGGKRRARIGLAASQAELSRALLQDFFRNLRAEASIAYFNAIQQHSLFQLLNNSYNTMKQLADADSLRFKLGAITEIDARQSKLEAGNLLNNLIQGEADWKAALVQLNLYTGKMPADSLLLQTGDVTHLTRDFSLAALISDAQANRADAVAAQNTKTVADKSLQLIKANRRIDLGVFAGIQYAGESVNEVAPTPAYRSFSAGISMPLKFSNINKGEVKAAQYAIRQSAAQYEQVLLQIQTEVTQAYLNYKAAEKKVAQYKSGLLTEAEKVLAGKIYSYKRGESSLLEVLNAQRTYNDVQQSYHQSLYGYAAALIILEQSAGIWDIKL